MIFWDKVRDCVWHAGVTFLYTVTGEATVDALTSGELLSDGPTLLLAGAAAVIRWAHVQFGRIEEADRTDNPVGFAKNS